MRSTSNNTARRGSTGNLTGASRHSLELSSKSPRTFSLSKQHIITNQQSLHSIDASTLRGNTPTPDPAYRSKSPEYKDEEFNLTTLATSAPLSARASLPRSIGSGASTLVQSSMATPTGSVYYGGSHNNKKGTHERDEIAVIDEVQIELGPPERNDTPFAMKEDVPRQPFKPFTMLTSPSLENDVPTYAGNSQHNTMATSPSPEDDLSTWTRLPPVRFSRHFQPGTTIPAPNFAPYYPNLSHAQVANAAGYREGSTPAQEHDVERALGMHGQEVTGEVGLAQSSFGGSERYEEEAYEESDRKYRSGRGRRARAEVDEEEGVAGDDEGDLVDVLQMFKEERQAMPPRRVEMRPVAKGEVKKKGWLGFAGKS
jgi:hypothetical protein